MLAFFFNDPATTAISTYSPPLSLHDAFPIYVWDAWLPERFRDRGPKVERRGIGHMRHVGGGQYEQAFDPDGPQADCWIYEDLVRSEEHTSELQSLMRISYAVFCLKKKTKK